MNSILLFKDDLCFEVFDSSDLSALPDFNKCDTAHLIYEFEDAINDAVPFEIIKVTDIKAMPFSDNPEYYSIKNHEMIRIGNACYKDIAVDSPVDLTLTTRYINLINGEVYLNGRLILSGEHNISQGDCLIIGCVKIIIGTAFVSISGQGFTTKLNKVEQRNSQIEEFPIYKRSPRIIKREPNDEIEVLPPPQKEQRKKGQLIKVIVPPLVMLCVMIAVSLLMNRGMYVLISGIGLLMTLVFSVTSFIEERKERTEKEKIRVKQYDSYLLTIRKRLYDLFAKQQDALRYHNPSVADIAALTRKYSSRIYERAANDADFLQISLGYSDINPSYHLKYKNDVLGNQKDELLDEMQEVITQFLEVNNVPAVLDLKKTHLGIVGEKKNIHVQLQSIIAQLCFLHSYHDIEIITLIEEEDRGIFEWIKWYPHCKIKSINVSGLVFGENQRDQVLGNIAQILKARKMKKEEEKKDGIYLPYYIFIVENPKLVINHSIMEYLQGDTAGMGISVIYSTNMPSNLPENIKSIMMLNTKDNGLLLIKEGLLANQTINLHQIDGIDLDAMSRGLAALIHNKGISTKIPGSITFFEMYKIKKPQELPVQTLWYQNNSYRSLAVPLGVRADDDYVYLNLHEKAHGPHGLVAGTTGSGKSEILQSYILSLAVNFHPYEVGFLLIDYKGGGMANLFQNLPHLLGTITNLDGSESMRALASIKSELARRQRIFNENGVNSINQYMKLFKTKKTALPLPHLFIISDEFAELKKEQPDFISELVSAARIGRSLGVHLILATQKPSGVVDDQIWSNSRFKLGLKVQNESDSNEVLKTPDAARITQPGRAYLQVGNNEVYELFQSAWSGAAYNEAEMERGFDSRIYMLNALGQGDLIYSDADETAPEQSRNTTQLEAVVEHINIIYGNMDVIPVEKPWLPPLQDKIETPYLNDTSKDVGAIKEYSLKVPIGVVDIPEEQTQGEYIHDFFMDGNLAVFGSAGSGKSTALMTTSLTLASINSPQLLNYYILDFGNSSLIQLKGLPHTADYLRFDDNEKMNKLVKRLSEEMRKRKLLFAETNAINFKMYNQVATDKLPAIILIIDNYDVVKEIGMEFEEFLTKLTRDGTGIGIYTLITASRVNAVRYAVLNNFKNKIAQFMFDPSDITAVVGRSSYTLIEVRGRALVKQHTVNVMQCYLPTQIESDLQYTEDINQMIQKISSLNTAPCAIGLRMLPEILLLSDFMQSADIKAKHVAIGLDTEEVETQYINTSTPVQLIIGMPQTGKTNLLKLILEQAADSKVFLADSKGYDLQEYDGKNKTVYICGEDQTEAFMSSFGAEIELRKVQFEKAGEGIRPRAFYAALPNVIVMIDDADNFIDMFKSHANEMGSLLEQAVETGISIIVTTLPSKLRGYDSITKLFKETQYGIVMGNPSDQTVFAIQAQRGYRQQIDMGFLYTRGDVKQIKIPLVSLG